MDRENNRERFLAVLREVQRAGGSLLPRWDAFAPNGYSLFPGFEPEVAEQMVRDLDYLAETDYLDRQFHDRLTICPACNSHQVNVREVCSACKSPNVTAVSLLHHFRCGHVAHVDAFSQDAKGGRRCPKCHGRLQDLGTDHDSPGENFLCHACHASFQVPEVEGVCLACHTRTSAAQLLHLDVYGYRLNSLGMAALRTGRLFERDDELLFEGDDSRIYRRHVFMSLLEDERRRAQRYNIPFAVVMLRLDGTGHQRTNQLVARLAESLRGTDKIGRHDEEHLAILLPGTTKEAAARWVDRMLAEGSDDVKALFDQAEVIEPTGQAELGKQPGARVVRLARP